MGKLQKVSSKLGSSQMGPGGMFLNSRLARVTTHVLARVTTHVLAHVTTHVLARALLHVLAHSSRQLELARVATHVLARVATHVLARVVIHVLARVTMHMLGHVSILRLLQFPPFCLTLLRDILNRNQLLPEVPKMLRIGK